MLNNALDRLRPPLTAAAVAVLLILFAFPPSADGQVVGGYVKVNSFVRKVTPSSVSRGQKFQGVVSGDATLLKDLPINTSVEVDYVVKAKPAVGQGDLVVGNGTIKVGPLPSVKAGANVNLTQTIDLMFPDSAPSGHYKLVMEGTGVRPFLVYMVVDLIIPGMQSLSMELGEVDYVGSGIPSPVTTAAPPGPASSMKLSVVAPPEATATTSISVDLEVTGISAEKVDAALYLQRDGGDRTLLKETSFTTRTRESVATPDYDGNMILFAEVKDYYVGGNKVVPPSPLSGSAEVLLKRRPLQASGKVDESGLVKQTFQVVSPDGGASVTLPEGTKAVTADNLAVTELTVAVTTAPSAKKGTWLVGQAYNIMPEGATLQPPASLNIRYDRSLLPPNVKENGLAVAAYFPATGWKRLPSTVDREKQVVSARVGHFSIYSISGEVFEVSPWLIGLLSAVGVIIVFFGLRFVMKR